MPTRTGYTDTHAMTYTRSPGTGAGDTAADTGPGWALFFVHWCCCMLRADGKPKHTDQHGVATCRSNGCCGCQVCDGGGGCGNF